MGSSGERKSSDTTRINTDPATPPTNNGGGVQGGGGSNGRQPDINKICPVKFRKKLTGNFPSGLILSIEGSALLAPDGTQIGTVDTGTLKQLVTCAGLGVDYNIQTVTGEGGSYAEFSHS